MSTHKWGIEVKERIESLDPFLRISYVAGCAEHVIPLFSVIHDCFKKEQHLYPKKIVLDELEALWMWIAQPNELLLDQIHIRMEKVQKADPLNDNDDEYEFCYQNQNDLMFSRCAGNANLVLISAWLEACSLKGDQAVVGSFKTLDAIGYACAGRSGDLQESGVSTNSNYFAGIREGGIPKKYEENQEEYVLQIAMLNELPKLTVSQIVTTWRGKQKVRGEHLCRIFEPNILAGGRGKGKVE